MNPSLTFLTRLLHASLVVLHADQTAKPASKPHAITDDQDYGDLSVTGNPFFKAPHLDRLALNGRPVTGTLYSEKPRPLPLSRVELKVAGQVQTADVCKENKLRVFSVVVPAGHADIEFTLLDDDAKGLSGGHFASVRKQ